MLQGGWRQSCEAWLVDRWQAPAPGLGLRLLAPLSWLYGALAACRRWMYRAGMLERHTAARPVIVVGNLLAGGAGKTPTVIALVELLRAQGQLPGVISRGHGRRSDGGARLVDPHSSAQEVGDEPLLIHLRTRAPVAVATRRIDAAHALCAAHPELTVLVCDDGLQHLALARDLEVLVFDQRGAGNGHLLPLGPLREALPAAAGPRQLVVYSQGVASTPLPGHLGKRSIGSIWPLQAWWLNDASEARAPRTFQGTPLLAAAGLARPEAFFRTLESLGLQIARLPLPDHHRFDTLPWPEGTPDVIVTEKDAVKLDPARAGRTCIWVARLDFTLPTEFGAALQRLLPAPPPTP